MELIYWGAGWCPPCNRVKALLFTDPHYQRLASGFTFTHIDGDSPGAQAVAERYKVRSYPTLIVMRDDGLEATRLPCEVDGERFAHLLELALDAEYTAAESLAAALSGSRTLFDDEWTLLAWYSWDTDEGALLQGRELAAMLTALARACPLAEGAQRLAWHALHAQAGAKASIDEAAATPTIMATLAAPRANFDVVCNYAATLVRYLGNPPALLAAWAGALERLESDASLDPSDRLAALRARVRMWRLGAPFAQAQEHARAAVAAALQGTPSPALRHYLVNTGAGVLSDAGLLDEAEQFLLKELDHAHAPYYFMHNLAAIAKKRGDMAQVEQWYGRAWKEAAGPATRLQWGATYMMALADEARAQEVGAAVLAEAAALPDMRSQRNRTQVQRIEARLTSALRPA